MVADKRRSVHESEADQAGRGAADPPPSRARRASRVKLARRITTWSCNLLASCVILILGLTFGSQVLEWWRGEPPSVSVLRGLEERGLDGLADPQLPHFLEFGARSSTLARVVFQGDRQAALTQLRRSCRDIAERAASGSEEAAEEASTGRAAEERLLHRLQDIVPVEQGEGWRIYQHDGPVLMVVAARVRSAGAERGEPPATRLDSVVSWGVGLVQFDAAGPGAASAGAAAPARWTLLTYSAAARVTGGDASPAWLVPPGGRRTMSMQVERGGTLVGLVGEGSPQAWVGFFDGAFAQRGWVRQAGWDRPGQVWHARYGRAESETCDVQLAVEEDGVISGILTIARVAVDAGQPPGRADDASAAAHDEGGAKPRAER